MNKCQLSYLMKFLHQISKIANDLARGKYLKLNPFDGQISIIFRGSPLNANKYRVEIQKSAIDNEQYLTPRCCAEEMQRRRLLFIIDYMRHDIYLWSTERLLVSLLSIQMAKSRK